MPARNIDWSCLTCSRPLPSDAAGNACSTKTTFSGVYASALCLQEAQEFLEAAMLSASAPEEAFQRFDVLAARHADALRQLTKKVQDARVSRDTEALKRAVIAYEEALEAYIPGNTPLMPSLFWGFG